MSYTSETVYNGEENIVIAIDLGTTHSAVSYSYLYPREAPQVRLVNKWPGQPEASGDSKIPTIVAYQNGVAKAFGAEAREFLDDDEYDIAKWFKLHLHPESMKVSDEPPAYGSNSNTLPTIEIPPLPPRTTLKQVYADFLEYMFNTTRNFFESNTPNGKSIWDRLYGQFILVLCTPNGWDTAQQSFLREAVVMTGIMSNAQTDTLVAEGRRRRLEFVTEGEASVHYALAHTQSQAWLTKDTLFAVTDAGGSTVDSTLYECKKTSPELVLEEVCASECVQAGGVFVDRAARTMLEEKLMSSRYNTDDFLARMIDAFEKKTKRVFDGNQDSSIIQFGFSSDNDRAHDIIKGKMSLKKDEVACTFDNVITRIVDSCLKLLRGRKVKHLLLVGGFGESPYLRNRLRDVFQAQNTEVVIVDEPSKKAAAEGAAIWFIKGLVVARAARFSIGTTTQPIYDVYKMAHKDRSNRKFVAEDGETRIRGVYSPWVAKNEIMTDTFKKTFAYCRQYSQEPHDLGIFSLQAYAWEGNETTFWIDSPDGVLLPKMRYLCYLRGDLSAMKSAINHRFTPQGEKFWQVDYNVVVSFGGTQLRAYLQWYERGILKEGPISILPNATF